MKTVHAVHVNTLDNCVTLTDFADAGDTVLFLEAGMEKSVVACQNIPVWHKMAVQPIERGNCVYKYGAVIGIALEDIAPGDHAHIHNIRSPGGRGS